MATHQSRSPRRVSMSEQKRPTSLLKPGKCPSMNQSSSAEQADQHPAFPQFRTRFQFISDNIELQQKAPEKRFIEFRSRTDPMVKHRFPVYEDKDIGIDKQHALLLNDAYNDDDDIDTKSSVLKYFIGVCQQDLLEGVQMNTEIVHVSFLDRFNNQNTDQ